MHSRHKTVIALIIGLFLGVFFVMVFLFFKGNNVTILNLKEDYSPSKTQTVHHYSKKPSASTYYTNKRTKNQYLNSPFKEEKSQPTTNDNQPKTAKYDVLIDLNTADTLDLQIIRGIGPVYARNIYNYGKRLGGYINKEQLKEVWGISDSVYKNISPYIVLQTKSVRKLNINTDNIKTLSYHPYIDYYLAKSIIQYRQQNGPYQTIEALKYNSLLSLEDYEKLAPYLTTE